MIDNLPIDYIFKQSGTSQNHNISIVGWSENQDGDKYWIVRNSWGKYFGDNGFFYVERGTNALLIESRCFWATIKLNWNGDK